MRKTTHHHSASFRDPAGFIFSRENIIYRQVNLCYSEQFEYFISSGLYQHLTDAELLIPHTQLNENLTGDPDWHTTLIPEPIPFISYPWEWSFDMLKDAALLTLRINHIALQYGMILKDASAFNLQWLNGKFIFIDTLSFENYNEKEPWIAYRQFIEHFLGPLLLMHYRKQSLQQMFLAWPEGIPLDIISTLLPYRSRWHLPTYLHIHLNARISKKGNQKIKERKVNFSKTKMQNILKSLQNTVANCNLNPRKSIWSGYYKEASNRDNYLAEKKDIITEWISRIGHKNIIADLGANTGEFSMICAPLGSIVLAADADPYCINQLKETIKYSKQKNIVPLICDLANPSPAVGFSNTERSSFTSRVKADLCLALALIHHLAIGRNIPFARIASYFGEICLDKLIIEFVPKKDAMLQQLIMGKKDIYSDYNEENFEKTFGALFEIKEKKPVGNSDRILYLMSRNEQNNKG